ncbi:MAG: type 1 glutamine amidotransferase [Clostridiales bacterium]|nr:type 1 glutamine amidotransferase [Clostridiales bacterium]
MTSGKKKIAILNNSINPAVYKPIEHWETFLDVPWESFRAVDGQFPDLADEYSHLLITGSEASIVERETWVCEEMEIIKQALEKGLPILGSCYGHQLLVLTLRGPAHVRRCSRPEVGWIPIHVVRRSNLLGEAGTAYAFSIHFDEAINLDEDFIILASTPACPVQAFELRNRPVWGVQFHPEIGIPAAQDLLQNLAGLGLEHSPLFERALRSRPKDSGIIRRIVRCFLEAGCCL